MCWSEVKARLKAQLSFARCREALMSGLPTAVEFHSSRMKMYDYYSMEMQSKFICLLPMSLLNSYY